MLARLARELPRSPGLVYEPKWDGFRCIVFCDRGDLDLRSRHQRPLARYFPELVDALSKLPCDRFVLDGEIVIVTDEGSDFAALMARLHPAASRVERLSRETPAVFIAFDLIALNDEDLRGTPFAARRARLEALLRDPPPGVALTPATQDPARAAEWLESFDGRGIDGVVAKPRDLSYQAGRRAMVKIKQDRTADCVVGGFRVLADVPMIGSLLLGLFGAEGNFRHVGVASSFSDEQRHELFRQLQPRVVALAGHPWESGFGLGRSPVGRLAGAAGRWTPDLVRDWLPIRPELVCEVAYDHWDGERFRHPARFRRWRPDREARSCTFEQLEIAGGPRLRDILSRAP